MTAVATTQLYLSRLLLNPCSRQVRSELAQPYEMHRTLMRGFPEANEPERVSARERFGVLFRAEVDDLGDAVTVLVQSRVEPDWSILDVLPDYLCLDTMRPNPSCKDIMPVCRNLYPQQVLRFRLRANPTKRIAKKDDPLSGKRVELNREEDQIAWLIRKGREREKDQPGGFELVVKEAANTPGEILQVPRVNVCPEGKQQSRKRDGAGGHATTHLAVLFEGLLRVTDRQAFLATLIHGIGPGKAFGFGLLSVAPCANVT